MATQISDPLNGRPNLSTPNQLLPQNVEVTLLPGQQLKEKLVFNYQAGGELIYGENFSLVVQCALDGWCAIAFPSQTDEFPAAKTHELFYTIRIPVGATPGRYPWQFQTRRAGSEEVLAETEVTVVVQAFPLLKAELIPVRHWWFSSGLYNLNLSLRERYLELPFASELGCKITMAFETSEGRCRLRHRLGEPVNLQQVDEQCRYKLKVGPQQGLALPDMRVVTSFEVSLTGRWYQQNAASSDERDWLEGETFQLKLEGAYLPRSLRFYLGRFVLSLRERKKLVIVGLCLALLGGLFWFWPHWETANLNGTLAPGAGTGAGAATNPSAALAQLQDSNFKSLAVEQSELEQSLNNFYVNPTFGLLPLNFKFQPSRNFIRVKADQKTQHLLLAVNPFEYQPQSGFSPDISATLRVENQLLVFAFDGPPYRYNWWWERVSPTEISQVLGDYVVKLAKQANKSLCPLATRIEGQTLFVLFQPQQCNSISPTITSQR